MGFSFRSMFQSATDPQSQDLVAGAGNGSPEGMGNHVLPQMQNSPTSHMNGTSPFAQAGALFKTASGEAVQAAPVQASASPFSVQNATASHAPLTVGDVLPQLPPELVRLNALSPDQPVAISPQVLDAALRSGQAALPIFEIYRVCPALFQAPVSPQDSRLVPLPAAKLPRLIASTQQAGGSGLAQAPAASPFGAMQPSVGQQPLASPFGAQLPAGQVSSSPFGAQQPVASPFGAQPLAGQATASPFAAQQPPASPFVASPGPATTALPPRRNGPPPPLADIPREGAPSLSLPQAGPAHAFPASPFAAMQAQPTASAPPQGSPFGARPVDAPASFAAPAAGVSMFAMPGAPPVQPPPPSSASSPFGNTGGATPASPFGAFGHNTPSPAQAGAAQESPFTSLFGPKASPTGQPAPDAPVRPPQPPASAHAPGVTMSASVPVSQGPGGQVRIGVAGLLRGYSVAELGFDPVMVPAWIMTSQPAAAVDDWARQPNPLTDLGSLIDGITDVGFRNVLNNAKRDFQVRLPQEEMRQAVGASASAAAAPSPQAQPPAPQWTAAQAQPSMTVSMEPPQAAGMSFAPSTGLPQDGNVVPPPAFTSAAASQPQSGLPASFQVQPPPQQSAFQPPASGFGGLSMSGFQAAAPSLSNPFAAAPPSPEAPPYQAPVAPVQAAPEPGQAMPLFHPEVVQQSAPAFQPPAQVPQPAPQAFQPPVQASQPPAQAFQPPTQASDFGTGFPPAQPPAFATAPTPVPGPTSFSDGFSSAELLGNPPLENVPEVPPAPSIPVTNPFTGKAATNVVDVTEERPASAIPPSPFMMPEAASTSRYVPPKGSDVEPEGARTAASRSESAYTPEPAATTRQGTRQGMGSPALGIKSHDTNPDQILLRALLGTDDELTPQRVVEMVCHLPGIAACVCLQGQRAISHVGAHKPQAREFQRQATDLAHHLRTLAPLIGIDGAETFTLTSGDRLMTFCFPEGAILGVLHDADPSLGLRDKITLIARELSRMLD